MNKYLRGTLIALAAFSLSVPALAATSTHKKGASQYAPGQMKEPGESAKGFAPGHATGPAKPSAPGQQLKKHVKHVKKHGGTSPGYSTSPGY